MIHIVEEKVLLTFVSSVLNIFIALDSEILIVTNFFYFFLNFAEAH